MSVEEAELAIACGADAVGLVGRMPSGPGPIPDELIRTIAATVPPGVSSFLLTCETSAVEIIAHHRRTCTDIIQLVDTVDVAEYEKIRRELPTVKLIQVIHVIDATAVEMASRVQDHVDGLLLDSGRPQEEVKVLGGTGRVHNWNISRKIVERSNKPVFLAGGLKPDNVGRAIASVHPFGVDVCTGVRTDGRLDEKKLRAFMSEVQSADIRD